MAKMWVRVGVLAIVAMLIAPTASFAGDAFLKLGIILSPDMGGFSNEWYVSAGSDWGFHPQVFWGLEFQGAYWSESEGDAKVEVVPANVFANIKWKAESEQVRPYVGAGVGLVSSYVRTKFGDESDNEWVKDAGFHFMGGVEFSRRFAVEMMGQKVFEDDTEWMWSILFGLRW
jgi:opacity protein-like surface antigen